MKLATNPTATNTIIAASSQVRSIERREGVSRAEAVIDDMTIGYPVSLGPVSALGLIPPGSHIAQFGCQVIGNCGVIHLPQRNERTDFPVNPVPQGSPTIGFDSAIAVGGGRNMTVSWHLGQQKVGLESRAWGRSAAQG